MAQYIEDVSDGRCPEKNFSSKNKQDKRSSGKKGAGGKGSGNKKAHKGQRARKRRRRILFLSVAGIILVLAIAAVIGFDVYKKTYNQINTPLVGKGTIDNPYLIKSVKDLEWLSLQVNDGVGFENIFFQQENDLDFSNYGNWMPIGACDSGYSFRGVYDGQGHSIRNITIDGNKMPGSNGLPGNKALRADVGLFGKLAGKVCNLRIESGTITGNNIGSIASSGTEDAVIVNCYNQASLTATGRCGGIADDLGNGKIFACANAGELICDTNEGIGGISSYSAGIIYGCYSTQDPVPEQFTGQIYRTKQMQDIYPGIADRSLAQAQKIFSDDLEDWYPHNRENRKILFQSIGFLK